MIMMTNLMFRSIKVSDVRLSTEIKYRGHDEMIKVG